MKKLIKHGTKMDKSKLAASEIIRRMVDKNQADRISFFDIKLALHERGFGLLMVAFSVPILLPLPTPPGAMALPAIPLLLLSLQMILGLDSPWLPAWIGKKTIKRKMLAIIVEKTAPYLRKVEKLLKPRLSLASSKYGEKLIGLFAAIFSIFIMIPIPLATMLPALGIAVMSLGLLSKDGVTIIAGMVIGSIGISISLILLVKGESALSAMFN